MIGADAPLLIPLDGSSTAEQAVPAAVTLASAFGAPIRFIHIADPGEVAGAPGGMTQVRDLFAAYARELAAKYEVAVGDDDIVVKEGPAAPYILAEAGNAGAIALASHGRSGFHATFIGSVADKVVRGANVPVLVVPAVPGRQHIAGRPIVVPLDGSEESERALPFARQLAPALGSEITLLRAFYVTPPATIEITYLPADYLDQIEEGAHAYLANVARPGEKVQVRNATASTAILQAAAELDAGLVVMASGGKGLARRVALGSTTDRVLHALHRPLLVIPPAADQPD